MSPPRRGRRQEHVAVDHQHVVHLPVEVRVAALQAVARGGRLEFLLLQQPPRRSPADARQAWKARRRCGALQIPGQRRQRPQFRRQTEFLRPSARHADCPRLGVWQDLRFSGSVKSGPSGPPASRPPAPCRRTCRSSAAIPQPRAESARATAPLRSAAAPSPASPRAPGRWPSGSTSPGDRGLAPTMSATHGSFVSPWSPLSRRGGRISCGTTIIT